MVIKEWVLCNNLTTNQTTKPQSNKYKFQIKIIKDINDGGI